jgi:hypothetical protein
MLTTGLQVAHLAGSSAASPLVQRANAATLSTALAVRF